MDSGDADIMRVKGMSKFADLANEYGLDVQGRFYNKTSRREGEGINSDEVSQQQ